MAKSWEEHLTQPVGTPIPHLATRFGADGRFLPEHGNTIVAQVIPGSQTEAALTALRAGLMALPYAHHFAFTAIPSYHMTVFEGVTETRRLADFWPSGLDPQSDIATVTTQMMQRLVGFAAPPPLRVAAVAVTPSGLVLDGARSQDSAILRDWRDALSASLGLRAPNHDQYRFHTTLAYLREWLPPEAVPPYRIAMARLMTGFSAKVPVLDLERPAFCTFNDMNAFPAILPL
jgi:hypothetical protein